MLKTIAAILIGYYGIEVGTLWLAWFGARYLKAPTPPPPMPEGAKSPLIYVVVPCREAIESIPSMVECLRAQNYPSDRLRLLLLIDSDDESDPSRALASSLGVEVYLRCRGRFRTKGDAINEVLDQYLKHQHFDAMLIFDVDSRVNPMFVQRLADYLYSGASVVQGVTRSKNPEETAFTAIGEAALTLTRVRQTGRAAMGLSAHIMGTGVAFRREVLERLGWKLANGRHLIEDLELTFRCLLEGIYVRLAPDLHVITDMPESSDLILRQRRRWSAGAMELVLPYLGHFIMKSFVRPRLFYDIFDTLLGPPFSVFFLMAGMASTSLLVLQAFYLPVRGIAVILSFIWLLHGWNYLTVLGGTGHLTIWNNKRAIVTFLITRLMGVMEGLSLACRVKSANRWQPMPHKKG